MSTLASLLICVFCLGCVSTARTVGHPPKPEPPAKAIEPTRVEGTDGDDVLQGTESVEHFVGGEGADEFVLSVDHLLETPDVIEDFNVEQGDRIHIRDVSDLLNLPPSTLRDLMSIEHGVLRLQLDLHGRQSVPVVRIGNEYTLQFLLEQRAITFSGRL